MGANPNPLDSLLKAAETQFGRRVAVVAIGVNADAEEYFHNMAEDIDNLNNFAWFQGKRYLCHPAKEVSIEHSEPTSARLKDILAEFSIKKSWVPVLRSPRYAPYMIGGLVL